MINFQPRRTENVEKITFSHLHSYGEIMSLLWRSGTLYGESFVATQRSEVQTPVNLGFYGIAYADGVPVGYFTYAMISDELQLAYLRGEVTRLSKEKDWYSGDNIWIASAVSPDDRAGLKMTRFIVENMPLSARLVRALRAYRGDTGPRATRKKRIVEWYRDPVDDRVKVRSKTVDALITELTSSEPPGDLAS